MSTEWQFTTLDKIDPITGMSGYKITLPPGDKCYISSKTYDVKYKLICDPHRELEFTNVTHPTGCSYEFVFITKHACPGVTFTNNNNNNNDNSYTSRGILFIIIIGFVVYCAGFSYMNYKKSPEDGLFKSLPHRDFWREFFYDANVGARVLFDKSKDALNSVVKGNDDSNCNGGEYTYTKNGKNGYSNYTVI